MSTKFSIVTSAADCCGKPQAVWLAGSSHSSSMEQKETKMVVKGLSSSHGLSLAVAALALATITGLAGTAAATPVTIYSDTFPGSATAPLNGTSPAVGPAGAAWTAGTNWNADGSYSSVGGYQNAFLPFSPAVGKIYTLAATIGPTGTGSGEWIALGFAQSVQTTQPFYSGEINPGPWMFQWQGADGQYSPGPALTAITYDPNGGASSPASLEMVLNTMQSQWTAQWYVDGNEVASTPYAYTVNPTITVVGFGSDKVSGVVSNFSLTSVPEPTTLALAAAGGIAMLLVLRRHRT